MNAIHPQFTKSLGPCPRRRSALGSLLDLAIALPYRALTAIRHAAHRDADASDDAQRTRVRLRHRRARAALDGAAVRFEPGRDDMFARGGVADLLVTYYGMWLNRD
jgi:hypothetical protein